MLIFRICRLQLFTFKRTHTSTSTPINHKTFERITLLDEFAYFFKILVGDSFTFAEICADILTIRYHISSHDVVRVK